MNKKVEGRSSSSPSRDGPGPWPGQMCIEQDEEAPVTQGGSMVQMRSLWFGFWRLIQRWLLKNTFTPFWLPRRWRTPVIGYLVALILPGIFVPVTLLLFQAFPSFAFSGVLEILVVALIALNWGAGPSLVATLAGAFFLEFVILSPPFGWSSTDAQQVIETLLFIFVGVIISIVASQSQRARRNAEELAGSLADERARLHAIIEAIPDVVVIHNSRGAIAQLNHAGQQLAVSRSGRAVSLPELPRDPIPSNTGEPLLPVTFPLEQVLAGETLEAIEAQISGVQGQESFVSVSAAPLRDQQGQVGGAVSIMRDITALRRNEQALREANRQMSDFLSLASHELRTPLTGITGHLQLAQRRLERLISGGVKHSTVLVEEEANRFAPIRQAMQRAEQQARLMNRLVGDLLDASRIQADRLALHPTPCNLAAIVQGAVEEQRYSWPNRIIALDVSDEVLAPLRADADRIGQVVTNYLTNALKYSPEDQPVEVSLRLEGRQARVLVRDHGPGVPADEQERIWELFHRAPGIEIQSGSGVGLGLGLHISRTIIQRHQGQVGVESLPGQGSTFWFTLPLTRTEELALVRQSANERK